MSLKAYKEAVKVGGRMRVIAHWQPKCVGDVRTVIKAQGNAFVFNVPGKNKPNGEPERFWSDFPKASQLEFDGKIAKVRLDENRFWELELLPV